MTGDSEAKTRVLLLRRWVGYCGVHQMGEDGMRWAGLGCEGGRWGSRQPKYRVGVCRQAGGRAGRRKGEVWMRSAK